VADRKHLHHKLLALGFDHYEAVVVIYLLQALLILAAWRLQYESDVFILAAFAVFAALITGLLLAAERFGWRWRNRAGATESPQSRRVRKWLTDARGVPYWALYVALLSAGGYVLTVAVFADHTSTDIAWLAAAMALLLLASLAAPALGLAGARLERPMQAALYISAVLAVFLDHTMATNPPLLHAMRWVSLPLLALAVALRLLLAGERRFQVTPLDALLLIVALVLPNLPGLADVSSRLGLGLAKLVVLLYAVELLFNDSPRTRSVLALVLAAFLVIVAARNLLPF
jgi:UDP-GlcNAc:undecaprenyl-phosphate GlcNAc-1-phosphate transferase